MRCLRERQRVLLVAVCGGGNVSARGVRAGGGGGGAGLSLRQWPALSRTRDDLAVDVGEDAVASGGLQRSVTTSSDANAFRS
jgi:hypothetical protein